MKVIAHSNPGDTQRHSIVVQPLAYLGLCAIANLNPAKSDDEYLNASCYWEINSEIEIEIELKSLYAKKPYYAHPRAANMYPIQPLANSSPSMFGIVGQIGKTSSAKVSAEHEPSDNIELQNLNLSSASSDCLKYIN